MDGGDDADKFRHLIEEYVRRHVALGELPYDAMVAGAVEYLADEYDPARVDALAREVARAEFAAHAAAQADWPEVTDSDRLTLAFRALDAAGIVARENFTCCQNCGLAEMGAEVADGETPRGYAFYHQQDAERGADGEAVYVAYGLFEQPPSAEIGAEVATALRDHDLPVDWAGDTGARIRVPLTWQRRRTGRLAAFPPPVDDDVTVEIEVPDTWRGVYAPTTGPISATRLASLYLPWLPTGTRIGLTLDGTTLTVRRDWDTLVGSFADLDRPDSRVDRYAGMTLVRQLRSGGTADTAPEDQGGPGEASGDGGDGGLVEATWEHSAGREYQGVPLSLRESVDLLRRMPVRTGAWVSFLGRSGGIVQMRWKERRLWLETPDPEAAASLGRHVTIPEAERMVGVLAVEDRVAVADLGDVRMVPWG
ncbi:hypothetical protein [Plantactinospora sp. BB1]|uniref:DUF6891 domain-containing protein n=1 Tax=Plantactinospora sp. BB1 TaxID=2071627 RepID=UPI000D17D275|nr:hypothetical protein [Plantactinospora sp. BB1]AVT39322.1 hypothetical protein C6W10_26010 [Plantactinospora sp. BB1]